MRFLLAVCLFIVLLSVHTEARLTEETEDKLRESGQKLYMKLSELVQKIEMKVKDCVGNWLAKDNLGEKLAEVVEILIHRLTKRIDNYLKN
ncbi:hypothetical protein CRM22_006359 [Opisthorchis felineus]|uniref:Uncharacterized protein n=1 Tax=Opisthorchis felineus TaxID=147828 RepID=A0A4S2LU23_OPIFE|nr:hypothetical protein CRM22_006359 [Opisthorchis felineus]